jgi:uncharacterized protein YndB with AHSA1/START domain
MALRRRYLAAPREAVWAALSDGSRYAEWVAGTREIRRTDPRWPKVGAEIEFVAGYGPLVLNDHTTVRVCQPPERLELEVRAGSLGTVRVAFHLTEWGVGTLVTLDEHPLRGVSAGLHGPPAEWVTHLRNRLVLRRLSELAREKARELSATSR